MRTVRELGLAAREWAAGFALLLMIVGPVGCLEVSGGGFPNGGGGGGGNIDLSRASGFFISESQGGAIFAARNSGGDAFFAYGEREGDQIRRVDALLYQDRDGGQSSIFFTDGLPTQVIGPDESSATITYEEVSSERLRASVLLDDRQNDQQESFDIDVDLKQTLEQIAALVRQVTGQDLTVVEVDDDGMTTKRLGVMQTRITIINPLYSLVVGFGAVIAGMGVVLGQILSGIVQGLANVARGLATAIFMPFFAISELLGATIGNIRLVPLGAVFVGVPSEPVRIRVTPL